MDWGMLGTGLNIEPRQQWDYMAYTPRGKARETYCMRNRKQFAERNTDELVNNVELMLKDCEAGELKLE